MYFIVGLWTSLHMLIFPCICPVFFFFHTLNNEIYSSDFCETLQAGVVIFCVQNDNDLLYCGFGNQPFHANSSQHLSNFLSFHTLNNEIFRQIFL